MRYEIQRKLTAPNAGQWRTCVATADRDQAFRVCRVAHHYGDEFRVWDHDAKCSILNIAKNGREMGLVIVN